MPKLKLAKTVWLFVFCAATAVTSLAQTFTTLASFDYTNGAYPYAPLVQGTNGNFYGTTRNGGANNLCTDGCGTIFKITPNGTLTTLYSFCSQTNCTDGYYPDAGLVQATNGNLYGTTSFGGTNYDGTVFEITPAGKLTTLYNFGSQSGDGAAPEAGLVQDINGNSMEQRRSAAPTPAARSSKSLRWAR